MQAAKAEAAHDRISYARHADHPFGFVAVDDDGVRRHRHAALAPSVRGGDVVGDLFPVVGGVFVSLDAIDVAFTEAAVGAGVSTVLMLAGMLLTARREKPVTPGRQPVALAAVIAVGAALFYATIDMPAFGDPNAPANAYVGQLYVERTPGDIEIPNIVTAVLASYRGFDTLGEVVVVFTAGIAVILLLGVGSLRGGREVADKNGGDSATTEKGRG